MFLRKIIKYNELNKIILRVTATGLQRTKPLTLLHSQGTKSTIFSCNYVFLNFLAYMFVFYCQVHYFQILIFQNLDKI